MKYFMLLYGLLFITMVQAQTVYYTTDGKDRIPETGKSALLDTVAARFSRLMNKPVMAVLNIEKTEQRQDSVIHWISFEIMDHATLASSDGIERLKSNTIPAFRLEDLHGKTTTPEKYKGKPTLINFWYTSCAPCIEEIPFLNQLAAAHKGEFNFVAITYEPREKVEKFLVKHPFNFEILVNAKSYTDDTLKLKTYPTNLFLDAAQVVQFAEGSLPYEEDTNGDFRILDGRKFEELLKKLK